VQRSLLLRKIIITILVIGFFLGLIWSYFYFTKVSRPVNNALKAVPITAPLIFECDHPDKIYKSLVNSNVIWNELMVTESFSGLNDNLVFLDSMLLKYPEFKNEWTSSPLVVSVCRAGANQYGYFISHAISPAITQSSLLEFISEIADGWSLSEKQYDGVQLFTVSSEDTHFSFALYQGLFIAAYSTLVVEDGIRQLNSKRSVLNDPYFIRIYKTAGQNVDARLYVKHDILPKCFGQFLNKSTSEHSLFLNDYAEWSELDLKIKPNAFLCNGFTVKNDSTDCFLSVFDQSETKWPHILSVLPHNTAFFMTISSGDFKKYYRAYLKNLHKNDKLFEYNKAKEIIETKYSFNVQKDLLDWIGDDIGVAFTESKDTNISKNAYVILTTTSDKAAHRSLMTIRNNVSKELSVKQDSVLYHNWTIYSLPIHGLTGKIFGNVFSSVEGNYYAIVNRNVVFANTTNAIKGLLRDYESEQSIDKNVGFNRFSENLAGESNLFIYFNIARSINFIKKFTNRETSANIVKYEELIKKFEGASVQVSRDRNALYYNNIYLNYNPVYHNETAILAESNLDTTVKAGPFIMINHYNHAKEFLIQDEKSTLYLINNTGKILWKRAMPEDIIGKVSQIDVFGNAKLQMLFNTKNQIWLIDRKGNNVQGFPIKLKSPATNPVSVFDYDNTKKYRLIIACQNKRIYNYDQTGRIVKGWNVIKLNNVVKEKLQHIIINNKDYIIAVDSTGVIYGVNRRGEKRLNLKNSLPLFNDHAFYLDPGRDLESTRLLAVDTAGKIHIVTFADKESLISVEAYSEPFAFNYFDIDQDGSKDFVYTDGRKLTVYSQDKTIQFSHEFQTKTRPWLKVFKTEDGDVLIGAFDALNEEVLLFDAQGYLKEGFPLQGKINFEVTDLNNDHTLNLISGVHDNKSVIYNLE